MKRNLSKLRHVNTLSTLTSRRRPQRLWLGKPLGLLLLVLFTLLPRPARAAVYTLDQYLDEVRSKSPTVAALQLSNESTELRSDEINTQLAPQLSAQVQFADDKTPPSNPATGDETRANGYSLGVAQQFLFGLQAKLSYSTNYINILNASPSFIPEPLVHTAQTKLELTQPLLRNGFGRETRAMLGAGRAQADAARAAEAAKLRGALVEAESAYLRLSLAEGSLKLQHESLERAEKIRNWIQGRVNSNLADRSDLLQAEAGVQARALELKATEDEYRSARAAFNYLRGAEIQREAESLIPLPELLTAMPKDLASMPRIAERYDTQAARFGEEASRHAARLGYEKNLPQLDLFGQIALNGRGVPVSDAMSQSLSGAKPTLAVGLKFSMPLDLGQLSDDRAAYTKDHTAAELRYGRLLQEQEKNWSELNRRLRESLEKLEIARKIEMLQDQKYARERERQSIGKTTTYFVLLFEQDLASSKLNRLRSESEVLSLLAQLKLFRGNS